MSITTAGRGLSAGMVTEVTTAQLAPILLASLSFSTPVHLWTGYGNLVYNSTTYLGLGTLGTISPVQETTDLAARGLTMRLSGVPTANVALALTENYQGRECSIMFGALADGRHAGGFAGYRLLWPDGRHAGDRRWSVSRDYDDRGVQADGLQAAA